MPRPPNSIPACAGGRGRTYPQHPYFKLKQPKLMNLDCFGGIMCYVLIKTLKTPLFCENQLIVKWFSTARCVPVSPVFFKQLVM